MSTTDLPVSKTYQLTITMTRHNLQGKGYNNNSCYCRAWFWSTSLHFIRWFLQFSCRIFSTVNTKQHFLRTTIYTFCFLASFFIYLFIYLYFYIFIYLFIFLFIYLFIYLYVYIFIYLFIYLFIYYFLSDILWVFPLPFSSFTYFWFIFSLFIYVDNL